MRYSTTVVTASEGLPITIDGAKNYLRITNDLEDNLIVDLIRQATDMVETYLRKSLITKSLKLTLDRIPFSKSSDEWFDGVQERAITDIYQEADYINLPLSPIISITSFTYYDTTDTSATLASTNYFLDSAGSRLCLKQTGSWPSDLRNRNAIEIIYKAGFGVAPKDIPPGIQAGVRSMVSALYNNRDCPDIPDSIKVMLKPYRTLEQMVYR